MFKIVVVCLILGALADRYGEAIVSYLLADVGYFHISGMFINAAPPPVEMVSLPLCHEGGYKIDVCPSNGE